MFASWLRYWGRLSCWGWPGGKNWDMFCSCSPRECSVSMTEEAFIVPVEFESRTEKDSRIECRSWGGSFDRLSVCAGWLLLKRPGLRAAADIEKAGGSCL
jgi:hypothetical protein